MYLKDYEYSKSFYCQQILLNQLHKNSFATCVNVTRLLFLFENLRLTLAKKRCEWECNKTIISETFCVFLLVKTFGYHLKVFAFKLNEIYICKTTVVEKH